MKLKYGEIGCIDAEIVSEPRFTNELGVVDLVYKIEEHEPYMLGELRIQGNARTKDKVIRREAVMAGLLPGEVLDKNRIILFERRLKQLGYFMNDPQQGKQIKIDIVDRRPKDKPYGELLMPLLGETSQARMQDPGSSRATSCPRPEPMPGPTIEPNPPWPHSVWLERQPVQPSLERGAVDRHVPAPGPPPLTPGPGVVLPGNAPPPPNRNRRAPRVRFPAFPGMNMTDVGPDKNDAFPNRSFADVVASVEEAPTGRFMIGVGANSFQGLMGNIQIYEKNFDITNFPRSFSDITNGQAFRGGGQSLQINLSAGNLINMMSVSLREPYLFDLPIGASGTGYLYQRVYPNWDERRGGGSFSLGRQLGTSIYIPTCRCGLKRSTFSVTNRRHPADYLAASGFTSLFSLKPSLRFDNRNSPFMATKGQYLHALDRAGNWGKLYVDQVRRRRTDLHSDIVVAQHPDGTGKQFFTLRGHFGVATESTPVYERYFAGNFGSLRGFQYRTVSPHAFDVPTGGVMMCPRLGRVSVSLETLAIPFTRSSSPDFGTVTPATIN